MAAKIILLSAFEEISELPGIAAAQGGDHRCAAIRLKSGGLGLYNPVAGLGEEALASLAKLGQVELLLTPNHYHNRALSEYAAAFPGAVLCASEAAVPRLARITGLAFASVEGLQDGHSPAAEILIPPGLKTGEVWLSAIGKTRRAWLVGDAFCGPHGHGPGYAKAPEMLPTFPRYGVRDNAIYRQWADERTAADMPALVIPCHGAMARDDFMPAILRELISSL